MKQKIPYIEFQIKDENETERVKIYTDDLRKMLNDAKLSSDTTEVNLTLSSEKHKAVNFVFKVNEIKKMIKQSILILDIIPNSLKKYLWDMSKRFSFKSIPKIDCRDSEIEKIWFYISQKKRNNVFLVGPHDVGKTAIAHEIIRQIATNECPKEFYDKRVIAINPESLLRIKNEYLFTQAYKQIIKFIAKNKDNIVLYVDKAIYMKTDEYLIMMLYQIIDKYSIPFITTVNEEDYEAYFLGDDRITKYINEVYIEEPEMDEIEPIIKNHILKLRKEYKIKITDEIVKFGIYTSCMSNSMSANPGNVINIFEKAFLEAKRKDKDYVDRECILSCYDADMKLYKSISEEDKRTIAYHEVGHYMLFAKSKYVKDQKISCVSILPMMDFLGVNWPYGVLGTISHNESYYIDYIAVDLGGRVAEKLITGTDSTTASIDLISANSVAEYMITAYGLSSNEKLKNRSYLSREGYIKSYLISEQAKQEIDLEIQKIIDKATKVAEEVINENRELIEIIVDNLLKKEILTGKELEKICEEYDNKNNK